MLKQELLNESYAHIIAQGGASIGPNEGNSVSCAYRGREGFMCAAGIFIKDYNPNMEHLCWIDIVREFDHEKLDKRAVEERNFVQKLQIAHDAAVSVSNRIGGQHFIAAYKEQIRKLVNEHNYLYPEDPLVIPE